PRTPPAQCDLQPVDHLIPLLLEEESQARLLPVVAPVAQVDPGVPRKVNEVGYPRLMIVVTTPPGVHELPPCRGLAIGGVVKFVPSPGEVLEVNAGQAPADHVGPRLEHPQRAASRGAADIDPVLADCQGRPDQLPPMLSRPSAQVIMPKPDPLPRPIQASV